MSELEKILRDAGFKTVVGADAVRDAIIQEAGISNHPLCSGYKVFPDGSKCDGCKDCGKEIS